MYFLEIELFICRNCDQNIIKCVANRRWKLATLGQVFFCIALQQRFVEYGSRFESVLHSKIKSGVPMSLADNFYVCCLRGCLVFKWD